METKNCYPARDPTATRLPDVQNEADVAIPEAPCEAPCEAPHDPPREATRETPREAVTVPLPRFLGRWARVRAARVALLCLLIGVGAGVLLLPVMQSVWGGDGDSDHLGGGLPSGGVQPPAGEQTKPETERETLPAVILPVESEADSESESEPWESDSERVAESERTPESESEAETERESETVPADWYAVVRQDLSEPELSVGYIQSTASRLPTAIPGEGERLWSTTEAPTVLLVHSHPYEGYHDGGDWYDPATGAFAQTDAVGASDGVVALGAELTGILRAAGVNVIHLRVPVGEGESASVIYTHTEEAVRYYCEMYPEIGLVIDLGRSAELTDRGEILRTWGNYGGEDCAQVRLSVSGDRATERVAQDIAVATALRRALWEEETSLSRPVLVKGGSGLAGELSRVAILTVELGSAGNSFSEAHRLLTPLGEAIASLVLTS